VLRQSLKHLRQVAFQDTLLIGIDPGPLAPGVDFCFGHKGLPQIAQPHHTLAIPQIELHGVWESGTITDYIIPVWISHRLSSF
jgi:hypothetical protein